MDAGRSRSRTSLKRRGRRLQTASTSTGPFRRQRSGQPVGLPARSFGEQQAHRPRAALREGGPDQHCHREEEGCDEATRGAPGHKCAHRPVALGRFWPSLLCQHRESPRATRSEWHPIRRQGGTPQAPPRRKTVEQEVSLESRERPTFSEVPGRSAFTEKGVERHTPAPLRQRRRR